MSICPTSFASRPPLAVKNPRMSPLDIFSFFPAEKKRVSSVFVNLLDSEVVGLNVSLKLIKLGTFSPGPTMT